MIILLPPSEGKSGEAGTGTFAEACPTWARETRGVLKHLKKLPAAKRASWYGVSTVDKARAAHAMNLAALDAPALPAIQRYTGVVYDHINWATLKRPAAAAKRVAIVSGLFGLVGASTPIPDYKLPMNSWLAGYWRAINTERLAAMAAGSPVLSLLPIAHAKGLAWPGLIHVDFKLAGGKASAGHFGKAIKGKFVRFLLEAGVDSTEDFAAFSEDGYVFDGVNFVQRG